MLTNERRQLFTKWRLYEMESPFGTIICYEKPNVVKIERYFRPDERTQLNNLILDLFFEYEWDWKEMSGRKLAILYWYDHKTIYTILNRIKRKIKNTWML